MATLKAQVSAKIIGISWRKIRNEDENDYPDSPMRSRRTMGRALRDRNTLEADDDKDLGAALLKRARSVRDVFGTLRQKLRVSTRRKKRLVNSSPYCSSRQATPGSIRRSARRNANASDLKMYSPFNFLDSPNVTVCKSLVNSPAIAIRGTPRQIRMGTHAPRRFNFSSPGRYSSDLKSVEDGIKAFSELGDNLDKCINQDEQQESGSLPQRDLAHQALAARIAQQQRTVPIFV